MVRVKICGITRAGDAMAAAEMGADAIGFIFVRESPRYVSAEAAAAIARRLPPFVSRVGVFRNENETAVREIAALCGLDALQLHGDESPAYCARMDRPVIRAFGMGEDFDEDVLKSFAVSAFLFDTQVKGKSGGTGTVFDWNRAIPLKKYGPLILAGGLNPGNVREAITLAGPYAVDVSSGVEQKPGIKDLRMVEEFIRICRES